LTERPPSSKEEVSGLFGAALIHEKSPLDARSGLSSFANRQWFRVALGVTILSLLLSKVAF